jgi:hypothetical protein
LGFFEKTRVFANPDTDPDPQSHWIRIHNPGHNENNLLLNGSLSLFVI